jgi:O-antigen ligase
VGETSMARAGMALKDNFQINSIHLYFCGFFAILFFGHKYVDLVRAPFIIFMVWQVATGRLRLGFFVDPVFIGVACFALTAMTSNFLNSIPQMEIVQILNWLYPYGLGKYVFLKHLKMDPENILLLLLGCTAVFSSIGILAYLFGIQELFGVELFEWYGKESRYAFTISGTNKAGFCIGLALVVNCYFFIKNGFEFTFKNVVVTICFLIIFSALFFLIKERKTLLMVCLLMGMFLLLYQKYKAFMLLTAVVVVIVVMFPMPQRYHLKEMMFNPGIQGRFNAWECAVGLFREKPVLGHGYPSFKQASAEYYHEHSEKFRFKTFSNYGIAHNLNLNALAETGIFGFFALNVIFSGVRRFYRYKKSAPLVFVLGVAICFIYITMQFGNFVHSATRTDITFLVFGMYAALEQRHRSAAAFQGGSQAPA